MLLLTFSGSNGFVLIVNYNGGRGGIYDWSRIDDVSSKRLTSERYAVFVTPTAVVQGGGLLLFMSFAVRVNAEIDIVVD